MGLKPGINSFLIDGDDGHHFVVDVGEFAIMSYTYGGRRGLFYKKYSIEECTYILDALAKGDVGVYQKIFGAKQKEITLHVCYK